MTGQDLKNSILQLAIQGKLVPQDANDEPASVLLERIKSEKQKLINEKKIKKEKSLPEITEDEKPFEIPDSWVWVRLGEIAIVKSSKRVFEKDYVNEGVPFFRSKEIGDLSRKEPVKTELFITHKHFEELKEKYGIPQKNDILITSVGSIGNTWICDGRSFYYKDGNITQICNSQYFSSSYIELFLHSSVFFEQISTKVSGTAYNALTIIKLNNLILPLPPLSEQHRIVAKIEELMPLVEEYDKAQKELDALNAKLPEALKKSILQEAIQGKLVPQDPNDEPASVLLQRIRKEKEQLVKDGKLKKKDLVTTPITDEEKPFEIPESWEWVRIPEIGVSQLGKTKNPNQTKGISQKYLCSINVYWNKIDLANVKEMLFDKDEIDKYQVKKGDLLICEGGDCGRSAIWNLDDNICYQNALHRVRFYCGINPFYVYNCLLAYYNNGTLNDYIKGETIKHLVKGKLDSILFPLPPLAEQHRIVSKIEDLFAQIEPLAKALSTPM